MNISKFVAILALFFPFFILVGCSGSNHLGVKSSPRVVKYGDMVPHGGGRRIVGKPYKVAGKWYYPKKYRHYRARGRASWYGLKFHGRLTANGEIFDFNKFTAAHPTMALPSYARVTNLKNGRSIIVRINDRGPFSKYRLIDVSRRTARALGFKDRGITNVEVKYIGRAPLKVNDTAYLLSSLRINGKRLFKTKKYSMSGNAVKKKHAAQKSVAKQQKKHKDASSVLLRPMVGIEN